MHASSLLIGTLGTPDKPDKLDKLTFKKNIQGLHAGMCRSQNKFNKLKHFAFIHLVVTVSMNEA